MKRKFTIAIVALLVSALGTRAQSFVKLPESVEAISNIEVSLGIDLTLVPVESYEGTVKVSSPEYDKISVTVKGNTLIIKGKKGWLFSSRVPVYVGVKDIKNLTVSDNVHVYTDGVLQAPLINVFLEGTAIVSLATRGDVQVYTTSDNEVRMKRKVIGHPNSQKAELHIKEI